MENSMEIPQKIKSELPYDPAIPLQGKYPKEMKSLSWKDICILILITLLLIVANMELI